MTIYHFSYLYKPPDNSHLLPVQQGKILSVTDMPGADGWVRRVIVVDDAVTAGQFTGIAVEPEYTPRGERYVLRESAPTPTPYIPTNGKRLAKGTPPNKRPDQMMRSPNLGRQY